LKEHGSVERAWLGVKVQAVSKSIADGLGLDKPKGVLIAQTDSGSPAATAGLKAGDVIVSINGAEVKNPRDLARKIGTTPHDTAIKLEIMRGGNSRTVEATVGKMKNTSRPRLAFNEGEADETGKLGITVAPAAETDGAGGQGLAILQVDPQGKAAEAGISAGDVMLKAGEQQLGNVGDLKEAMAAAAANGKSNVLVLLRRGDTQRYVAISIA
jgi:serine protease Do